jgi:hypothetical protein
MAITTLDGIIAGAKPPIHFFKYNSTTEATGTFHSLFYAAGMPGPAAAPTSALTGDALTSYAGQLPMPSFANNTYLMKFAATANQTGTLLLCDRLWHNATIDETLTTGQTINSVAWPARDANGAVDGAEVLIGIECSTATTNGSAVTNTTLTYTNSGNTGSRTASLPSSVGGSNWPATAVAGTFATFHLQAGDVGVKSIQTLTLGTSYGGGEIHLVAYRVLAAIENLNVNLLGGAQDMVRCGFPRLYDNTVPFLLWYAGAAAAPFINGEIVVTQG